MNLRRTATLSGWLWIATFVTSIPAYFTFYAPMRGFFAGFDSGLLQSCRSGSISS